jgi:hypothetical protein
MGWWENTPAQERAAIAHIQIKVDNGPESSGVRAQFLKRIVEFADHTRTIVQLLYYPPYHSKYNPIERCWGILEQHWNGATLVTAETMLEWAKSMTWKRIQPAVNLSKTVYQKGISLSKVAMQAIEAKTGTQPNPAQMGHPDSTRLMGKLIFGNHLKPLFRRRLSRAWLNKQGVKKKDFYRIFKQL